MPVYAVNSFSANWVLSDQGTYIGFVMAICSHPQLSTNTPPSLQILANLKTQPQERNRGGWGPDLIFLSFDMLKLHTNATHNFLRN